MNLVVSGAYDGFILILLILTTLLVMAVSVRIVRNQRLQMMLALMLLSVFFYSGYGISYNEVSNTYFSKYVVFIVCLVLPFLIWGRNIKEHDNISKLDRFLFRHYDFVQMMAFVYLACNLIPLIYPRFKLFDIFTNGFQGLVGFYDLRVEYRSNALIGATDAIRIFTQPLFFAYLIMKMKLDKKAHKTAVWLFGLVVLMHYMRYSYLSRYQMVIYALLIYLLAYSVNVFKVKIKFKHIATIVAVGLVSLPMLYVKGRLLN